MRKFDFVWSLLCLLLLISCHHKKPDETVETILVYPEATMPQKFVTTDFASDSIFNLPEEMSVPSRLFQKTDGLNSRLITLMVKQWYVVKQIKYAENYKMWLLISDQKEACMLLTLNENNEPIDGLPVALHL